MKKIIAFGFAITLVATGCRPASVGTTYGTDQFSAQQRERCERSTGKRCAFNLCQTAVGAIDPEWKCDVGWQPID